MKEAPFLNRGAGMVTVKTYHSVRVRTVHFPVYTLHFNNKFT